MGRRRKVQHKGTFARSVIIFPVRCAIISPRHSLPPRARHFPAGGYPSHPLQLPTLLYGGFASAHAIQIQAKQTSSGEYKSRVKWTMPRRVYWLLIETDPPLFRRPARPRFLSFYPPAPSTLLLLPPNRPAQMRAARLFISLPIALSLSSVPLVPFFRYSASFHEPDDHCWRLFCCRRTTLSLSLPAPLSVHVALGERGREHSQAH